MSDNTLRSNLFAHPTRQYAADQRFIGAEQVLVIWYDGPLARVMKLDGESQAVFETVSIGTITKKPSHAGQSGMTFGEGDE